MTGAAVAPNDLTVVILAAGTGDRMLTPCPKQFMEIGGADEPRTVLDLLLESYQKVNEVEHICLVAAAESLDLAESIAQRYPKVQKVILGGATRHDSVCAGVAAVGTKVTVFHDAARPLLDPAALTALLDRFQNGARGVATVARPYASMLVCADNGPITGLLEREEIGFAMCPVAFYTADLRGACAAANERGLQHRDLPGLMLAHRPDMTIETVIGHRSGFKLTYPEDLDVLEVLLRWRERW